MKYIYSGENDIQPGFFMKAVILENFSTIEDMTIKEIERPVPADNEVQIHIAYAGVNPVDWKIIEGHLRERIPHKFPLIPGWDAAGTISGLGKNVTEYKVGDEVFAYCRKPVVQFGTYADFISCPLENIALKPKTLSMAQSAAIPLVALTAWQALFDFANLKKGQTVFIHAGSGGVGSMAIGFAKNAGAKVYTTASKRNHEYVSKLGADIAIDYRETSFVEEMKKYEPEGVDVVFDTMGSQTLEDSYQLVKKNGYLVSLLGAKNESKEKEYGIHTAYVFVTPNSKELQQIAALFDDKKLVPPDIHEFAFNDYLSALKQVKSEYTRGKNVLQVNP